MLVDRQMRDLEEQIRSGSVDLGGFESRAHGRGIPPKTPCVLREKKSVWSNM